MIGQTISHYKILEKLGEGGMGVVYKAQDTKLDRFVALKFLPAHVSVNEEVKARFIQEAKAAAALNHAHICTIHGIEEEGSQMFIVMEFVEGGTLREKLPFSKTNEALSVGIQIGEALQEAHSKGIVHRDIKADNIMLTVKGEAKVMDFGLAKLKGSLKLTRASSTVGTLAYMAPEQIQGGEVDNRSDIFSFGVLLFEMLTGKTPFRGEHEAALVYSIVNEEPESLQKFVPDASPELMHILTTALEKDCNDRYQSVDEMTRELRRLLKQSSKVSRGPVSSAHIPIAPAHLPESQPSVGSKKMLWLSLAAGVVIVAAIAMVLMIWKKEEDVALGTLNPNMTLRVLPISMTQFSYPGLSADGNWVAFPAADANNKWDIYYMHVAGSETRRITTDSMVTGQLAADISPDGSQVTYEVEDAATGQRSINVSSSVGGMSKKIVEGVISLPRWRPDGQRIGYVRLQKGALTLWSVKPDGSDNRLEFADSVTTVGRYSFCWSPDGRSVAWIRSFKGGYQEVFTHDLETGKERQLTFDNKNNDDVAWTRNGFVIFSSNRGGNTNLWTVRATGGTAQQLTKGSGPDIGISVSSDGQKLVYLQQQRVGHVWISDLASSTSRQTTFDDREIISAALSPDGKRMALAMAEIDPLKPGINLYLQDRDGSNRRQLTTGDLRIGNLTWSPDGKWVAFAKGFQSEPLDSIKIFVVEASNPGIPKEVGFGVRAVWLNSSRFVAQKQNAAHEELLSVEGAKSEKFYEDSTSVLAVVSGNAILYVDRRAATKGWWMISADYSTNSSKSKPKKVPDPPKGANVQAFSAHYLYYTNQRGELWRQSYSTGKQEQLRGSFAGLDVTSPLTVSQNEKEILFIAQQLSAKLVMIENIFK